MAREREKVCKRAARGFDNRQPEVEQETKGRRKRARGGDLGGK